MGNDCARRPFNATVIAPGSKSRSCFHGRYQQHVKHALNWKGTSNAFNDDSVDITNLRWDKMKALRREIEPLDQHIES